MWYCRCDEISLSGDKRPSDEVRATYGTAQKMRAAMSHKFGRDLGLGIAPWTAHPLHPGKFVGNPSLSPKVSQYMISLQWCKVRHLVNSG